MPRVRSKADHAKREATTDKRVTRLRSAKNTSSMAEAALIDPDKPLTDMQLSYAAARARGESVPSAMAIAGYNDQPSYGYRMEKMPNIQQAIAEERKQYAKAAQMTRKKVIDMQLEAYDMARILAEPSSMVAAAREIGKICGFYETNININSNATIKHELHRFEGMSDEELLRILAESLPKEAQQQLGHDPESDQEQP